MYLKKVNKISETIYIKKDSSDKTSDICRVNAEDKEYRKNVIIALNSTNRFERQYKFFSDLKIF